ncbi:hypothetical protein WJX82_009854 [Trebouxia sp. C0006]
MHDGCGDSLDLGSRIAVKERSRTRASSLQSGAIQVGRRSSSTTLHINSIRSIESDCIRDSSSQGQMNLDCSAQSDVTLSHVIHAAPRLLENTANKPSQRLLL